MPIFAAAKAGDENNQQYSGGGCVVDHLGSIVAKAGTDGDELVAADLDLAAAERFGEQVHLVRDRRPEAYEAISRTDLAPVPTVTKEMS
jgi:predicted amidohydrolase